MHFDVKECTVQVNGSQMDALDVGEGIVVVTCPRCSENLLIRHRDQPFQCKGTIYEGHVRWWSFDDDPEDDAELRCLSFPCNWSGGSAD